MYRLSNYVQLIKDEISNKSEFYYYVVFTKKKAKLFVINEVIYSFLKHFEVPNTLELVVSHYADNLKIESKNDLKKLKEQFKTFFTKIVSRKWIVKEDALEPPIEFITQLNVNDEISKYQIKSIIANKKVTDLYLVAQKNKKKLFVLKLLNKNKFNDENSFNMIKSHFKNEFNFLKKFNSIYINKTSEIEYYNTQPFIILEYIKGVTLSKFVKNNTLKKNDKLNLVLKILKGFSIIHDANVYHGDIHLSNILVKINGQPKIIDFGYSNNAHSDSENTRNGGVYAFIPPERALRSIDRRFKEIIQFQSEVYQIGLLIFFIYVKKLPFEATTWKTMVDEKMAFDIRTFQPFLSKKMSKSVRSFIIRSLDAKPENRFLNAIQMHKEWQNIVGKA